MGFRSSSYLQGELHSSSRYTTSYYTDENHYLIILPIGTPYPHSSALVVCFTTHSKNYATVVIAQRHTNTPHPERTTLVIPSADSPHQASQSQLYVLLPITRTILISPQVIFGFVMCLLRCQLCCVTKLFWERHGTHI